MFNMSCRCSSVSRSLLTLYLFLWCLSLFSLSIYVYHMVITEQYLEKSSILCCKSQILRDMVNRAHIWRISNLHCKLVNRTHIWKISSLYYKSSMACMVDRAHIWRTSNLHCKTSIVWLTEQSNLVSSMHCNDIFKEKFVVFHRL